MAPLSRKEQATFPSKYDCFPQQRKRISATELPIDAPEKATPVQTQMKLTSRATSRPTTLAAKRNSARPALEIRNSKYTRYIAQDTKGNACTIGTEQVTPVQIQAQLISRTTSRPTKLAAQGNLASPAFETRNSKQTQDIVQDTKW